MRSGLKKSSLKMNPHEVKVYPWREESLGSKEISKGLGVKRLRLEGSTYVGSKDRVVINWGASDIPNPEVKKSRLINTPSAVEAASNKLTFFKRMKASQDAPRCPEFTDDPEEAIRWVREGACVLARTKLKARSGADIVFLDRPEDWAAAPLYTKYVKKAEEYRVHVAFGEVIKVQQKVLRSEADPKTTDFRIRNLANGFIFQIHNLHTPEDVLIQAQKAMAASKLHFGAVDVIWNNSQQKAYVLEINTAPGIEGSTVIAYVDAFKKEFQIAM